MGETPKKFLMLEFVGPVGMDMNEDSMDAPSIGSVDSASMATIIPGIIIHIVSHQSNRISNFVSVA